jgi:hypothetical protein
MYRFIVVLMLLLVVFFHSFSPKNFTLIHSFFESYQILVIEQTGGDFSWTQEKPDMLGFEIHQDHCFGFKNCWNHSIDYANFLIFRIRGPSTPEPHLHLVCSGVPVQSAGAKCHLVLFIMHSIVQETTRYINHSFLPPKVTLDKSLFLTFTRANYNEINSVVITTVILNSKKLQLWSLFLVFHAATWWLTSQKNSKPMQDKSIWQLSSTYLWTIKNDRQKICFFTVLLSERFQCIVVWQFRTKWDKTSKKK